MELIPDDIIPVLPESLIVDEECVALGVVKQGVLIHYIERDNALLINWEDIVNLGKGVLDEVISADKPQDPVPVRREIERPHHRIKHG
jgi:hypothetical protein